jgi:YVTN family beta-propeller protein
MSLFIKTIKWLASIFVVLFLTMMVVIYTVRLPSYTIKTNGKLYIVNKLSKDITVFDLNKGQKIAEIPIDIKSYQSTKIAGQDKIAVANYSSSKRSGKNIILINTNSNKIEKTILFEKDFGGFDGIVALPERNKIGLISRGNNEFLVVDTNSELVENKIATQQETSHFFVLHPRKPLAYVTNVNSESVSVINFETNKLLTIIPCGAETWGIAITPDGSEIWVTNKIENSISIINTLNNRVVKTLKTGKEPLSLNFSIDGTYCLVANANDGTIAVFNQRSKIKIKTIGIRGKKTFLDRLLYHTPRPVNVLMHPNGKYAFVANSNANKIEVIDMNTFTLVSTIETGKVPEGMIFIE